MPLFTFLSACSEPKEDGITACGVSQVNLTDAYAQNALNQEVDYLLSLSTSRLLANFRKNADLSTSAIPYDGWENSLIGGHTLGHYLTGLAQAYANAGTSEEQRAQILQTLNEVIDELKECQDHSQGEKGFLWGGKPLASAEQQFNNVEKNRTNITTEAWVPWYTMHKILAGLIDVYTYTGNKTAKDVASALGDWVYNRTSKWTAGRQALVLGIEYGGMNDCLYNLYRITGNQKHAVAAHMFDEQTLFDKILEGKKNYLNDLHANTTIPKIIGALNRYVTVNGKKIDGEKVDASEMVTVAEKFWDRVVNHHTYVTGGNSEWEHFGKDDILDAERTNCNNETCNVYNMLKLSRMLFEITGDKKYLDYYENAYINQIWSSQNPETGMATYFQPMATGYFKVYSTPEKSFWCCTGSAMESMTKLNDSIYYQSGDDVYVAMYLDSTLRYEVGKNAVTIQQTADLEHSNDVSFAISGGDATLKLRIPDWTDAFNVSVNGKEVSYDGAEGFAEVSVKDGDNVAVKMNQIVTGYTLPDAENAYAFKYGPYVLSAELGTKNMATGYTGVSVLIPSKAILETDTLIVEEGTVEDYIANISNHLVANGDKFILTGTDTELTYSYHFRQYTQRYGIYFYFADSSSAVKKEPAYTTDTIDTVQPGYGQYEVDDLHAMDETNTVSVTNDGTYRYAKENGFFTYRMAVNPDAQNYLIAFFRKSDNGKTIEISSGEDVIYSSTLAYYGDDDEYKVILPIPERITKHTTTVNANDTTYEVIPLTFRGVNGAESAKVCSFLYTATLQFAGERDETLAYFVDCGDYDVTTVSDGDKFGTCNSVTEQVYGMDFVTGKYWGIYDDANPQGGTAGSEAPMGIGTANTWAYEFNNGDNLAKTESNRYTKNQFESGKDRELNYLFELEDGTYTVELYFTNPWGCSSDPCVTANGTQIITNAATNTAVTATVEVKGGQLMLTITSSDLCINLAYIKIAY